MKRIAIAAAVLTTVAFGSLGAAQAIEFNIGPGGVHIGDRDHWRHGYRAYGYGEDCRVIVRREVNRFGDSVTTRRRVCD
jgi:hypothetical protein